MKINDPMHLLRNRKGQFKHKRNKGYSAARVVLVVFVILLGVYSIRVAYSLKSTPDAPRSDSEIQTVMSREDFKKRVENQAKQIYLAEQINKVKSEYDAKLSNLEAQLEEARKEELSLQ